MPIQYQSVFREQCISVAVTFLFLLYYKIKAENEAEPVIFSHGSFLLNRAHCYLEKGLVMCSLSLRVGVTVLLCVC